MESQAWPLSWPRMSAREGAARRRRRPQARSPRRGPDGQPPGVRCHAHHRRGHLGEPKDPAECRRVLKRAVDLGVNFIDTADAYGPEVSERLDRREPVSVSRRTW